MSAVTFDKSVYSGSVITHSMVRIWKQIKVHFRITVLSFLLPIAGNPSFPPSQVDSDVLSLETWVSTQLVIFPGWNLRLVCLVARHVFANQEQCAHPFSFFRKFFSFSSFSKCKSQQTFLWLINCSVIAIKTAWENELWMLMADETWEESPKESMFYQIKALSHSVSGYSQTLLFKIQAS